MGGAGGRPAPAAHLRFRGARAGGRRSIRVRWPCVLVALPRGGRAPLAHPCDRDFPRRSSEAPRSRGSGRPSPGGGVGRVPGGTRSGWDGDGGSCSNLWVGWLSLLCSLLRTSQPLVWGSLRRDEGVPLPLSASVASRLPSGRAADLPALVWATPLGTFDFPSFGFLWWRGVNAGGSPPDGSRVFY